MSPSTPTDPAVERAFTVVAPDGVTLAGATRGPADAPVLLCVHGYPDDRHVWDGVAALLADRYRVVTYDVRGAGRSGRPRTRAGYGLDRLAADLAAVIAVVSPDRPVHLVGHDWGSIQTWHAVTGAAAPSRAASYTSISGPCLDHAARWFRGERPGTRPAGTRVARLRQGLASGYVGLFQVPVVPELIWRSPLGAMISTVLGRIGTRGTATAHVPATADLVHGLELYRANMLRSLARPGRRTTSVPVQVLTPTGDVFVTPALQEAAGFGTDDLVVRPVRGGHWVVRDRPDVVAGLVDEFVRAVDARPAVGVTATGVTAAGA